MRAAESIALVGVLAFLVATIGGCDRSSRTGAPSPTSRENAIPMQGAPARSAASAAGPDAASVAVLDQALHSPDYATRLIAIEAAGDARTDALAGRLGHALGDPEHDVRMAAIEALD